ncbi:MAG: ABC transporter permease [Acidobacteria bacterium]|nr:ABC transporter permease [Acidobacteriota bacterium]
MSIVLKIAWRNLWRKPRRTLLTVFTISLGLALLLIILGLGDGSHKQMIESAVHMGSGHVLVQQKGYLEKGGIDRLLSPEEIRSVETWSQEMKGRFPIRHILRRTFVSGLASSADGSTGVQLIGIQPQEEMQASDFDDKLIEGEFLNADDGDWVILGQGVAHNLALEVGEKLVLMAQGVDSVEIRSRLVRVRGILRTGLEERDQALALMPLGASQDFLDLGTRVHQIALLIQDAQLSEELALIGKEKFPALEVLSWGEALPQLKAFIRLDDGGSYVMNLILFLLISFTVLNTLLMSVLERGREFALLHCLGLTPGRRFVMVLVEAFFIAFLSALTGFGLGYSVHLYLSRSGLPLDLFYSGDLSAAGVAFDPVMYSHLSPARILQPMILVFVLTRLLSLVPAWRAARSADVHLLGRA